MMRKGPLGVLFAMIFTVNTSYAMSFDQVKTLVRKNIEKYLGDDIANKLFGESNGVKMPEIPALKSNAKDINIYKEEHTLTKKKKPIKDKEKYDLIFLKEVFITTRMIAPNANDLGRWMNVLNQGATREGVYRALVLDNTYAGLENFPKTINEQIVEFTNFFLGKFVNQKVNKAVLSDMNFFTIKRIMVEKALEVIDAYGENEEDLSLWYGIFSSDMAKRFNGVWGNQLRSDENYQRHKGWAKSVPKQHVKSEIIIKLHKAMNSMI